LRSGEVGRLVANDYRSSVVELPLFDRDPRTGEPMDYWDFSQKLETDIRDRYQSEAITIRIVGFAKMVGDLLDGIRAILVFAIITFVVTALLLVVYSQSVRATCAALACSLIAVVWQLGLLNALGYGMDAFSILVPFLVFAIAVSHGVQVLNAVGRQQAEGVSELGAARLAFRRLYIPGTTALVSDAVGFLTMLLMPIQVIRELGIAASVGVAVIIVTNLVLLPLVLSYTGLGERTIKRLRRRSTEARSWNMLAGCARRPVAGILLLVAAVVAVYGVFAGRDLQIGDLDAGAPELRPDSRYNLDSAYIANNYSTSSDVLVILVETAPEQCADFENLSLFDEFLWVMRNVDGVESAVGASTVSRLVLSGFNEGSLKWATITRNQSALNTTFNRMPEQLMNRNCSLLPAILFLSDHKATTLQRVLDAVEAFAAENNSESIRFVPAAGNAGVEAATNQEIADSRLRILYLVYAAVAGLVLVSFGSLRAVLCIICPLALTSVLCQALMAKLGIGVKVATLPVIALGVGVGVDYGIYVFARFTEYLKRGLPVATAWRDTLLSTGKAVAFTGVTLAIGVATWIFSPIKFQADMGMLLTFMFLLNMVGALTLLPALASFLYREEGIS
jgi:predicted RND superfamily exporter protein